jgi:two-component system, LytTR family, response regulator LytT
MNQHKLNILIVEDELLIAEMLKEMLLELSYNVVAIAKNFESSLTLLKKHSEINFAILDINLSETKTGLDIAKTIREEYNIPFVFLTSYSNKDVIKEAVTLKPEAYLIKPFTKTDLFVTLELITNKLPQTNKSIIIKDGHLNVKLFHKDILWLKSENIYLEIYTTDAKYVVRTSLDRFLEDLDNIQFIRIHRSYAINLNQIKAINGQYVLIGTEKIPMSRNLRDELMEKFNR